ncbi:claudin-2 isoform X2 [Oncorhynchus clarkii lewisi]|uniref:claudin-2 isoform X2 n=1 Tax=Oncorhynchus clarkii lewisi TaxID=490388 RepID=UPI0039B965A2
MASAALELMGFFMGLLGMLGTLVSTVLPYWRTSAHIGPNIVTAVANMKGLWMECVYQSTGAFQCETYNSMLALPSDLQASRALMVVSVVFSVLAVVISTVGMQCTICMEGSTAKGRVAGTGGGLFLTAGFLALIPVSWTTHEVVQTFYQANLPNSLKYELGDCLYVGLAAALLSMLGGGLLCVSCCEKADGGRRGGRRHGGGYPYPAPGMGVGTGRARTSSQTYRNPTLQMGVNAATKAATLARSHTSTTTQSSTPAQGAKKDPRRNPAVGYDVTGYV